MKLASIVLSGGVNVPSIDLGATSIRICNGEKYISYNAEDELPNVGHENWLLAPYRGASMGAGSETLPLMEDVRIKGIVWTTDWRTLETSEGVYNFAPTLRALDQALSLGKKLIVRVYAKTYSGAFTDPAAANPTTLLVPDYIVDNPAVYGGAAYRGGIYKVYSGGVAVGWGPVFETAAVRARWKALVTAAGAAIGSHAAFAGWMGPDESTRSAYTGSGLPAEINQAAVIAANQDIWTHDISVFGSIKVWPVINYIDSTETIAVSNQATIDLQTWVATQGMNIAVSDTYRVPEKVTRYLQPVYYSLPRNDLAANRKTLVHVDLLSLGANDAGLTERMIETARQAHRLGADITVWNPYPVSAGGHANYFVAQKVGMDATA